LLCDGGGSANAITFQILLRSDLDLVPIESVVLVEARVLGGNDRVLEIARDLAERNELVAFMIRRVANPGLHAALDVHRSCGWVDPAGRYKHQSGKQPKKYDADESPSNKGSKESRPKRGLGVCVRHFRHTPE
jgi:hypothetical protein